MLISRKLTQDKRIVTGFRHLSDRIAKNNLAYPLLKGTISIGFKGCISLPKTISKLKEILQNKQFCIAVHIINNICDTDSLDN